MSWLFGGSKTKVVAESTPESLDDPDFTCDPIGDKIFDEFIALCDETGDLWTAAYEDKKKGITVWTKKVSNTTLYSRFMENFKAAGRRGREG